MEASETFSVRLGSPVGSTIADGSGLGRITNDDAATLSVDDVTMPEGDAGTTAFTFTVTRTGAIGGTATVQWSTADVTATAGGDYVAVPATTLSFAAGETSKLVSVGINGDTVVEADEIFDVRLGSPVGPPSPTARGWGASSTTTLPPSPSTT